MKRFYQGWVLLCLAVLSASSEGAHRRNRGILLDLDDWLRSEISFRTYFEDSYGTFSPTGNLSQEPKAKELTFAFQSARRIVEGLEAHIVVPWSYRSQKFGNQEYSTLFMGDIDVGARWLLSKSVFQDDWFPTVAFLTELGLPTGSQETRNTDGRISPGTGTGKFEPRFGIELTKRASNLTLSLLTLFTKKFARNVGGLTVRPGDELTIAAGGQYSIAKKFFLSLGTRLNYSFSTRINGIRVANSSERSVAGYASGTYLLDRQWALECTFDHAIPIRQISRNADAKRRITLQTSYAFF